MAHPFPRARDRSARRTLGTAKRNGSGKEVLAEGAQVRASGSILDQLVQALFSKKGLHMLYPYSTLTVKHGF
jgi:hypothetical protein